MRKSVLLFVLFLGAVMTFKFAQNTEVEAVENDVVEELVSDVEENKIVKN